MRLSRLRRKSVRRKHFDCAQCDNDDCAQCDTASPIWEILDLNKSQGLEVGAIWGYINY